MTVTFQIRKGTVCAHVAKNPLSSQRQPCRQPGSPEPPRAHTPGACTYAGVFHNAADESTLKTSTLSSTYLGLENKHTNTRTHAHTHTRAHMHAHSTHTRAHAHKRTHTHARTRAHTRMHAANTHTLTHTRIHARAHTRAHTHFLTFLYSVYVDVSKLWIAFFFFVEKISQSR